MHASAPEFLSMTAQHSETWMVFPGIQSRPSCFPLLHPIEQTDRDDQSYRLAGAQNLEDYITSPDFALSAVLSEVGSRLSPAQMAVRDAEEHKRGHTEGPDPYLLCLSLAATEGKPPEGSQVL